MAGREWTNASQFHDIIDIYGSWQVTKVTLVTEASQAKVTLYGHVRGHDEQWRELSYNGEWHPGDDDVMPGANLPGWVMVLVSADLEVAKAAFEATPPPPEVNE